MRKLWAMDGITEKEMEEKAAEWEEKGEITLFCFGDSMSLGAEYTHLSLQIYFNTFWQSHCPP